MVWSISWLTFQPKNRHFTSYHHAVSALTQVGPAGQKSHLEDAFLQTGRLKPIFSIRELKLVGFTPKSSAAPSIPLIFQLAFSRTAKMFSRSRRRISASVGYS